MRKLLVGGAVRDLLMGNAPKDKDFIALDTTENELLSLGYKKVGKDFPVFLDPKTKDEIALPRVEISTGPGYNDFKVKTEGISLKEDLRRRDLTINAMAMTENGEVVDYFGGLKDLELKILRHTSEAFSEDPLRVLRLARFAARYPDFTIHSDTEELCRQIDLSALTPERVFKELDKALYEENTHLFFITLHKLGVLDKVFPEIAEMDKVEHNNDHHLEGSVFNHTMMALKLADRMDLMPIEKFSVLLHDIGKPHVHKETGKMHGHDNPELCQELIGSFCKKYRIPNAYKNAAIQAATHHHHIHLWDQMKKTTRVKTFNKKTFPKSVFEIKMLINVATADAFGRVERKSPKEKAETLDVYLMYFDRLENTHSTHLSLKAFLDCKAISEVRIKDFMKENPDASIETIQNHLHKKRIQAIS